MGVRGIVIRQADELIQARGRGAGLEVICQAGWDIPFEQTLFAGAGLRLDKELIVAGMRWLDKWDMAAPLMGPGALAANLGRGEERQKTLELVHDLRVPVYSTDLIFAAQNETARACLKIYEEEGEGPQAFLRALYRVKPRFLALPRQWMLRDGRVGPENATVKPYVAPNPRAGQQMISCEVSPGRFVKCWPGEEEKMIERHGNRGRHGHSV